MPITALDPHTALIVVDLQKGTTSRPTAHPIDQVVARAAELVSAFRGRGLPVVLARFDPSTSAPRRSELGGAPGTVPPEFAEFVPDISATDQDIVVTKGGWSAFTGTGLAPTLRERGVTQVVLAGVATTFGVESTARSAHDEGFHVTVATDAVTDPVAESHERAVRGLFRILGETGETADIVNALGQP